MSVTTNTTEVRTMTSTETFFTIRIMDPENDSITQFGRYESFDIAHRSLLVGRAAPVNRSGYAPVYEGNRSEVVSITKIVTEQAIVNFFPEVPISPALAEWLSEEDGEGEG